METFKCQAGTLHSSLVQDRYEEVEAWSEDPVVSSHPLDDPGLLLGHEHHPHVEGKVCLAGDGPDCRQPQHSGSAVSREEREGTSQGHSY